MSITPLPQRTKTQIAAGMKQNPGHVSKDRGIVGRFTYMGWEGGIQ